MDPKVFSVVTLTFVCSSIISVGIGSEVWTGDPKSVVPVQDAGDVIFDTFKTTFWGGSEGRENKKK